MPVSETANWIRPAPALRTFSETLPCSVNLTALASRFLRICCRRWLSASSWVGASGAALISRARPFCTAIGSKVSFRRCSTLDTARFSSTSSTWPASIRDRSRMSLINASRSLLDEWIAWAYLTCSAVSVPSLLSASSLARISALLSGVRSSWDMLARNSDL